MELSHCTAIQPLKSVLTITEVLIFPGFVLFFHDIFFIIFKFHDMSMTGKANAIFPGFPGAVGTLDNVCLSENCYNFIVQYLCHYWQNGAITLN